MILLDTNVVSETMRPVPEPRVLEWLDSLEGEIVGIPAVVMAELYFGLDIMPDGRRREDFRAALARLADEVYRGFIMPFNEEAARVYGRVMAERQQAGRAMSVADGQIAATALANNAQLATRDVDFANCGIEIINPWMLP